jgi:predicted permease
MIHALFQELRRAARLLARSPGLTATVAATLALGIATCAVFFGFVEGVWTRPLPGAAQPTQLVYVSSRTATGDRDDLSYPDFVELSSRARSFASLAATQRRSPLIYGDGFVDVSMSNIVSEGYFAALGVHAAAGRLFADRDAGSPSAPVLVMSHSYWQRRFAGDPGLVGGSIRVGNTHFTVVGVAAQGFRGTELWSDTDLWIPVTSWEAMAPGEATQRQPRTFEVIGRLKPGVSLTQARAEAAVVAGALASAFPATDKGRQFVLQSDRGRRFHASGSAPLIILALVSLVLIVACANATALLLARAEARQRVTATHVALGCTRWRLFGQALAESAVLVALAASAALAFAHWGVRGFSALLTPPDPRLHNEFHLDGRVAAFTLLVSAVAVLLASLAPLLVARRIDIAGVMRGEPSVARRRSRAGSLLVGAQMVGAMFLSTIAALFLRSLINTERADLGFERKGVLAVALSTPYEPLRERATYDALLARTQGLPQVKRACLASRAPLSGSGGGSSDEIAIPDREPAASEPPLRVRQTRVGAGYFKLLGTRVLRGREFGLQDNEDSQRVVVVNQTMARTFWPEQDPVGHRLRVGTPERARDYMIVGVVQDARVLDVAENASPHMYLAYAQSRQGDTSLLVETAADPLALAASMRSLIRTLDPNIVCTDVTTLGLLIRGSTQAQRNALALGGLLAALNLLLAAVGLYALMSYSVRRRSRELGLRIALGAQVTDVVAMIMQRGLMVCVGACLLGSVLSLAATPMIAGLLYGVAPRDWASLAGAAGVLLAVATFACYLPARRAAKVDPMVALRCE